MIRSLLRGGWLFKLHLALLPPALVFFGFLFVDLVLNPSIPGVTSIEEYAIRLFAGLVASPLTLAVGLFCIRRAPGNVVGPIVALWGCGVVSIAKNDLGSSAWIAAIGAMYAGIIWPACFYLFSFFPNGRVYPRRMEKWVSAAVLVTYMSGVLWGLGVATVPGSSAVTIRNPLHVAALEPFTGIMGGVDTAGAAFAFFYGIVSLSLRFRNEGPTVRQQMKWMLWGFAVLVALALPDLFIRNVLFPGTSSSLLGALTSIWLMIFPVVAIGNAILRHRLYDIDVIIRRTLVYSTLTVLLALTYWGGVVGLEALLRPITGQGNDLAVVATTLTVVVLFLPLRRRIQGFIDRRFYRRKYDAARTLAAFSDHVRDEVALDKLTGKLVEVVDQVMQPEHTSLWLRPASRVDRPAALEERS